MERGQGVLKYERIKLGAKIAELFGNASGEFFHFVFVPKSLVYVLLGVVFVSCSHSVFECVEFGALPANMPIFRVLRAFLAGFGVVAWVCLVWALCVA